MATIDREVHGQSGEHKQRGGGAERRLLWWPGTSCPQPQPLHQLSHDLQEPGSQSADGAGGCWGTDLGSPKSLRLIMSPQMGGEFIPKLEHSVTLRVMKVLSGFSCGWGCLHSKCREYSCDCRQTRASLIGQRLHFIQRSL